MLRAFRIGYPGTYSHVMNRGDRRGDIFITYSGRAIFADRLTDSCETYEKDKRYQILICE
jgi:hypothetical protein